jgi:hypothetical protein
MRDAFTLAHELGHAGHFMLAGQHQRPANRDAAMPFVEAPSIMNEVLLARHILARSADPRMRRWVLTQVLWDRHEAAARDDVLAFEKITVLLEDPALSRIGRRALLDETHSRIGMAIPETSLPHVRRLALAQFRLLGSSHAADVHDQLVSPYLPNLLGISSGMPRRNAAEIFAGASAERASARAALAAYHGPAKTEPLAAWLAAK